MIVVVCVFVVIVVKLLIIIIECYVVVINIFKNNLTNWNFGVWYGYDGKQCVHKTKLKGEENGNDG